MPLTMITSRFTDSGDARIHYLDSGGDDRGAPIVFVPGMTDIAEDYTELLDDSPHDIFRPDRGRYPRLVHGHAGPYRSRPLA